MKKNIIAIFSIALALFVSSCEMEPVLADVESVEIPDVTAMRQMMDGAYVAMSDYRYSGRNMIVAGEVRADNVYANGSSGRFIRWSAMNILSTDGDVTDLMRYAYGSVSNPNIILGTDVESIDGEDYDKHQILGESYLMRAYAHFDLVRLFGQRYSEGNDLGISYIKEFKGPKNVERGTVSENITDIKSDIETAISHFQQGTESEWASSKTNFNLDAAYALQSRVGTYFKEYDYAIAGSSMIVDNYPVTPEADFVEYWEIQTPPAASIMELYQNTSDNNAGINGIANIYRGNAYGDLECREDLLDAVGFEAGDVRASEDMIGTHSGGLRNLGKWPSKGTELGQDNLKLFRVEEIVLNHAEALTNGAGSGDPLAYLNRIPSNRGASNYGSASMENILKERRKELLFEGFRFFDFARMGMNIPDFDAPNNSHGEVAAGSFKFAFPIPQREIDSNLDAVQNPGY